MALVPAAVTLVQGVAVIAELEVREQFVPAALVVQEQSQAAQDPLF